jgi:hypothetical protein
MREGEVMTQNGKKQDDRGGDNRLNMMKNVAREQYQKPDRHIIAKLSWTTTAWWWLRVFSDDKILSLFVCFDV